MPDLADWDSFYVIVGGAAGALIGLQFVVMTLIADRPPLRAAEANSAFGTPTIVHFSAALLLSALMRAPWHTIPPVVLLCGLTGLAGIIYILIVARRMRKQAAYRPDYEDWSFFVLLPLVAYAMLAIAAFVSLSHTREALFGVGGSALFLLFIGIHNAWDSVAFLVFSNTPRVNAEPPPQKTSHEDKG
jgi:hypothetical protein